MELSSSVLRMVLVSFGTLALLTLTPSLSEAEITLKKGYVSKTKPKNGILLYLHGCSGLSVRGPTKEWFRHFERSGYRVYAQNSFAEKRPKRSCKPPFPNKAQIHSIRLKQINRVIDEIRKIYPKKPIYVWAKSEGANLAYWLEFKFAGVVTTGYGCGLGSRKIALPNDVPLMALMGNPMIDTFLEREVRRKGFSSMEAQCQHAMKPDKWHWKVFPELGHFVPIWNKRVREAVNKVIPINLKYAGQRPPPKPALGARYRLCGKAQKALQGKYRNAPKNKAFAIGPNCSYARQFDAPDTVDATMFTLYWCQTFTRRGKCALYDVNGHKVLGKRYSYTAQRVQQRLTELGFEAGTSDGVWGGKTKKALNEFRISKGHSQVDKLDESSLTLLGLEGLELDTN